MTLKEEFQKYVGQSVLNPWRSTADYDDKAAEISKSASEHGYLVVYSSDEHKKPEMPEGLKHIEIKVEPSGEGGDYKIKDFVIN